MSYDIWFAPNNTSHIPKNRAFLDALAGRGERVHLLCIDSLHLDYYAARPQILQSGLPYEELQAGGFDRRAHWLRQAFQRRALARAIQRQLGPLPMDALVVCYDGWVADGTLVQVVRGMGVPVVLIPDGLVLPPNPRFSAGVVQDFKEVVKRWTRRVLGIVGDRGTSGVDLILVMNETGRQEFIRLGVSPERVVTTGSAEYDALARQVRSAGGVQEVREVRERLGLPADRPIVLFAHQGVVYGTETARQLVQDIAAAARSCGAALLVKFHPRSTEYPDAWRQWAAAAGLAGEDLVFVREECTSIEAARLCAVCATAFSTVALEALVCGKPLVLINYLNVPIRLDYGRRYGGAIEAPSPGQLADAIVSVVTDAAVRDRLRRGAERVIQAELGGLDGRSAERMVQAVSGLLERRMRAEAVTRPHRGS
jgi:glycosyltransferase involved in cell wall biosynthesis